MLTDCNMYTITNVVISTCVLTHTCKNEKYGAFLQLHALQHVLYIRDSLGKYVWVNGS